MLLQRFKHDGYWPRKVTDHVKFEETLDVSEFTLDAKQSVRRVRLFVYMCVWYVHANVCVRRAQRVCFFFLFC